MRLHICPLDKQCRSYGAPPRIYFSITDWVLIVALWPSGSTQAWYPWSGYTKKWRPVVVHPARDRLCMVGKCSRLRGHRGDHRSITWRRREEAESD